MPIKTDKNPCPCLEQAKNVAKLNRYMLPLLIIGHPKAIHILKNRHIFPSTKKKYTISQNEQQHEH